MTELKETGGARIGMASATWIFATLSVSKDKLELKCNYNWQFGIQANDIVSLVPQSGFLSHGLKIVHRVPTYKDDVIFWTSSSPMELLGSIEQTGFLKNNSPFATTTEIET
jgi:hypothetical protein